MDNQRIKKTDLLDKQTLKQTQFFNCLAKDYLSYLGNPRPSAKQMAEMQALLSHVWVRRTICFDIRLTIREQQCLYLVAQGKGMKEIASFLNDVFPQSRTVSPNDFSKARLQKYCRSHYARPPLWRNRRL